MVGIVKLALRRPYTFVVMALLIMIFGVASALRTTVPDTMAVRPTQPKICQMKLNQLKRSFAFLTHFHTQIF
jgi:hypothetical protein